MAPATARAHRTQTRVGKKKMAQMETPSLPVSFQSPESSTIDGADYDESTQQLTVYFRGEKVYDFPNTPPAVWAGFVTATSKGAYFSAFIRPLYPGVKRGGRA